MWRGPPRVQGWPQTCRPCTRTGLREVRGVGGWVGAGGVLGGAFGVGQLAPPTHTHRHSALVALPCCSGRPQRCAAAAASQLLLLQLQCWPPGGRTPRID